MVHQAQHMAELVRENAHHVYPGIVASVIVLCDKEVLVKDVPVGLVGHRKRIRHRAIRRHLVRMSPEQAALLERILFHSREQEYEPVHILAFRAVLIRLREEVGTPGQHLHTLRQERPFAKAIARPKTGQRSIDIYRIHIEMRVELAARRIQVIVAEASDIAILAVAFLVQEGMEFRGIAMRLVRRPHKQHRNPAFARHPLWGLGPRQPSRFRIPAVHHGNVLEIQSSRDFFGIGKSAPVQFFVVLPGSLLIQPLKEFNIVGAAVRRVFRDYGTRFARGVYVHIKSIRTRNQVSIGSFGIMVMFITKMTDRNRASVLILHRLYGHASRTRERQRSQGTDQNGHYFFAGIHHHQYK